MSAASIAVMIVVSAVAYAAGMWRLSVRRASRQGRTGHDGAWFAAGLIMLAGTLLGPLDEWAERSFALHMTQHELIMLVVAPMLVRGRPLAVWTWALARGARLRLRSALGRGRSLGLWYACTSVVGACALQALALWAWHLPAWFRAALAHPGVHILQHATFLAVALCFWWSVLRPGPRRNVAVRGIATLFFTTLTTGALGALLTFAGTPWYAGPDTEPPFGLTLLEDQQVGGLIMWIPGGTVYLAFALWLAARALSMPTSRQALEAQ
jgi:putative membrane protein